MGYQITYGVSNKNLQKGSSNRMRHLLVAALIFVAVLVRIIGYDKILLQFLLPGDHDVTASALGNMVLNLENGATLRVAFAGFCREIIDHAQIY